MTVIVKMKMTDFTSAQIEIIILTSWKIVADFWI